MFCSPARLKSKGVLGINRRNSCYTLHYNRRSLYPRVDDKLITKQLALQAGMAVPELYGVIEINHQARDLEQMVKARPGFVVKPAKGSGGEGIMVLTGAVKEMYRTIYGPLVSREDLKLHVLNILSGMFSLGGQPDKAIIEYRVEPHPVFEAVAYRGVPDIRIIVLLGVPVMAMARLPTSMSDGKANLHMGAIGAGINIRSGITTTAVCGNAIISEHPDTAESVVGISIPQWDELLLLAARCYELTGLGYQGVDIVLDRARGPLILEVNARPGLNIQLANRAGLASRLKAVEEKGSRLRTAAERTNFAKEHFG